MTQNILSLSYGKDSLACFEACRLLGYRIDRAIHAEVWATDTIPADLPPMVEFKKKADAIIKERYGITVEHICATRTVGERERESLMKKCSIENSLAESSSAPLKVFPSHAEQGLGANTSNMVTKLTYEDIFYRPVKRRNIERESNLRFPNHQGKLVQQLSQTTGFATRWSQYCTGELKRHVLTDFQSQSDRGIGVQNSNNGFLNSALTQGADINIVQYLGIAADETERIKRHTKPGYILPLVDIGWDEAYCRKWCEENDLLSPIYTDSARGGCWFCHNQGVDQLRLLRRNYPDLWKLLLKWDKDSPTTFHSDGHTVRDFDKRFMYEDLGLVPADRKFRWKMLDMPFPQESEEPL